MENAKSKSKKAGKKKVFKKRFKQLLLVGGLFFFLLLLMDCYVGSFAAKRLYYDVEKVPHRSAALVLGCSKYTHGRPNIYYEYRLNAAAELWNAGKIDAVLVSGDNSRKEYDEPSAMKADLIKRGVPAEYIAIDYAGFRTLDSIYRADKIFGLEDYIVVSQQFHCKRAIFLARIKRQSVIGYCARDVAGKVGLKVRFREVLARAKAVFDVITFKSPKFYGKKESVNYLDR